MQHGDEPGFLRIMRRHMRESGDSTAFHLYLGILPPGLLLSMRPTRKTRSLVISVKETDGWILDLFVRLIGLKSFAVVWVAFPALGMKTTFVSRHTVGSSPTARTMWKIFLSQFIASCPACYICYVPVLSRPVPAICMV